MLRCGLLGRKLGHSYSPQIHKELGDYSYELFEREPEDLEDFLKNGAFDGINVTIPYKKSVVPYCAELSAQAKELGSVNTIVRRADGSLYGDNSDYFGFLSLVKKSGIETEGKKALVLGSGGASVTVCAVLRALGCREVIVISRSGEDNYENVGERHADADIVANTTPCGMYPNTGEAAIDLSIFRKLSGVLDIVYNPARTALMLQAEAMGIPTAGGLYMLVAQAKHSSQSFQGKQIPDECIGRIEKKLAFDMQNIVLVGMPGSGKSVIAAELGRLTGKQVLESDKVIVEKAGMSIPDIFAKYGEEYFRNMETEVLKELGKQSGIILSTGGGVIMREVNYAPLHQNGTIFCLNRSLDKLPTDGRPVSQSMDLKKLYEIRKPHYERFADHMIDNNGSKTETAKEILRLLA